MAELLQFKLYLNIGGKQEEVRRFSCDGNIDIGRLNVHIKETFPHLGEQEFGMKWEDEEGDKVDITSQQELMLALREMKKIGPVYKIHVQLLENPWWKQVSVHLRSWQGIKTKVMYQNMGPRRVQRGPEHIICYHKTSWGD